MRYMDDSSKDAIFASSLKAAAAATAGSSASKQVIFQKSEDGERLAKVERLRRQIAAGEYPTNTAEISKRLIDDHLAR
jgi:anti-sigma28 factor (negative regulator of flagellin synthesis)